MTDVESLSLSVYELRVCAMCEIDDRRGDKTNVLNNRKTELVNLVAIFNKYNQEYNLDRARTCR